MQGQSQVDCLPLAKSLDSALQTFTNFQWEFHERSISPRTLEIPKYVRRLCRSLEGESGRKRDSGGKSDTLHRESPLQRLHRGSCQGRLGDKVQRMGRKQQAERFVKELKSGARGQDHGRHGTFSDCTSLCVARGQCVDRRREERGYRAKQGKVTKLWVCWGVWSFSWVLWRGPEWLKWSCEITELILPIWL